MRPFHWLHRGWDDLQHGSAISLRYGFGVAVLAALVLALVWGDGHFALVFGSTFALIAPVLAIDLYALSKQFEQGDEGTALHPTAVWWPNRKAIGRLALGLIASAGLWAWLCSKLVLPATAEQGPGLLQLARELMFEPDYRRVAIDYLAVAVPAAVAVVALTLVSLPLLVDRGVDCAAALHIGLRAAAANPGACLVWSALVTALIAAGLITGMVGLVVIFPWLAHAGWHGYRDMVD